MGEQVGTLQINFFKFEHKKNMDSHVNSAFTHCIVQSAFSCFAKSFFDNLPFGSRGLFPTTGFPPINQSMSSCILRHTLTSQLRLHKWEPENTHERFETEFKWLN